MQEVAGVGVVSIVGSGLVVLLVIIRRRQSAVGLAVEVTQRVRVGMHHCRRRRWLCSFIIISVRAPTVAASLGNIYDAVNQSAVAAAHAARSVRGLAGPAREMDESLVNGREPAERCMGSRHAGGWTLPPPVPAAAARPAAVEA